MHQNRFLTTPDVENYLCEGLDSGGLEMHQNMFLTVPDVKKKSFLRPCFWWSGNASKHVFNHSRDEKIIF